MHLLRDRIHDVVADAIAGSRISASFANASWQRPVIPGGPGGSRRNSVVCSATNSESSGRGPTRLISPRARSRAAAALELGASEESPDAGEARVDVAGQRRSGRTVDHLAELEHDKNGSVEADSPAAIEDGTAAVQLDGDAADDQWEEQNEERHGYGDVEESLRDMFHVQTFRVGRHAGSPDRRPEPCVPPRAARRSARAGSRFCTRAAAEGRRPAAAAGTRRAGDEDHVIGVVPDGVVPLRRDCDDRCSPGARLLDVRDELLVHVAVRGDADDGRGLVE